MSIKFIKKKDCVKNKYKSARLYLLKSCIDTLETALFNWYEQLGQVSKKYNITISFFAGGNDLDKMIIFVKCKKQIKEKVEKEIKNIFLLKDNVEVYFV